MWFEKLTGFKEENPTQVRNNLIVEGDQITSKINGRSYQCGTLDIPSLGSLKKVFNAGKTLSQKIIHPGSRMEDLTAKSKHLLKI